MLPSTRPTQRASGAEPQRRRRARAAAGDAAGAHAVEHQAQVTTAIASIDQPSESSPARPETAR